MIMEYDKLFVGESKKSHYCPIISECSAQKLIIFFWTPCSYVSLKQILRRLVNLFLPFIIYLLPVLIAIIWFSTQSPTDRICTCVAQPICDTKRLRVCRRSRTNGVASSS